LIACGPGDLAHRFAEVGDTAIKRSKRSDLIDVTAGLEAAKGFYVGPGLRDTGSGIKAGCLFRRYPRAAAVM